MRLGKILAEYRTFNAYGIRGLAKQIGVSKSALSRIENGGGCDTSTLVKILFWLLA